MIKFNQVVIAFMLGISLWSNVGNAEETSSIIDERIKNEAKTQYNRFVITPHKLNYVIPFYYRSAINTNPYEGDDKKLDPLEVKFQFSVKAPIVGSFLSDKATLFAAYTNVSYWQAYNKELSSPFRETNHEPELFLAYLPNENFLGLNELRSKIVTIGLSHQSNGRGGAFSRSWNRLYGSFVFELGNFHFLIKTWYRFEEDKKKYEGDPEGDDNPDILDYMGYGEFICNYMAGKHSLTLLLRNNLRAENKGAIQLEWSFPINKRFKAYVQYFNGYGESLIDYNVRSHSIGIGVLLTDYL